MLRLGCLLVTSSCSQFSSQPLSYGAWGVPFSRSLHSGWASRSGLDGNTSLPTWTTGVITGTEVRRSNPDAQGNTIDIEYIYMRKA